MTTLADIIFVALDQTFCAILGLSIVGKSLRGYTKQYTVSAILLFFSSFMMCYLKFISHIFQPMLVLVDYCLIAIILKLVFNKSNRRISLELIVYVVIYNTIELFSAVIFIYVFGFGFDDFNNINVFKKVSLLESLVFLVIYIFLPIRNYIDRYENVLFKYLLFGLNFFVIYLISMSFIKGLQSNPNLIYLYYFLIFASLMTTYLTIKVFRGPREEIVLREQFLEFEKTLGPVLDELHTIQHDFKQHLKTLNELCATVKKESYLGQEVNHYGLEAPKTLGGIKNSLRLSNKVLEAIIYCKFQEAKAKNIDLRCQIPDEEIEFPLKNYEYTTVIANLLDNACEAVEKNEEGEKDRAEIKGKVILELGRQKQQSYIEVRNTGIIQEEIIPNLFKKGYSTKEKNLGRKRGLGLYNVQKMVDKYNGNIEVCNWQNQVVFRVSF